MLSSDAVWSGDVLVGEDVLVAPGAVLTIQPGTRVRFSSAPSTKTDPVFWNPDTELAVAGRLQVLGTREEPVVFEAEGPWGGIVAASGADVLLRAAVIRGAGEGLLCAGARCRLEGVRVEGAEYGLVLGPQARLEAAETELLGCRVGVLDAREAPTPLPGVAIARPTDAAVLSLPPAPRAVAPLLPVVEPASRVEYVGEYTVEADEAWSGEVVVAGRVTVVPGAVLTLTPGTRVAFRKVDTNGDGLGEGELLVLGGIRSLGEPGRPVVFDSAEPDPRPGDWDKVSLISAESPDNLFRHTVFRHGTQALHGHFSRFGAESCLFEANLRGVQFQESEGARLEGCVFLGNKQAARFRDSAAVVAGNVFLGNLYAVHAFRCDLSFTGNTLEGNALGGVLAKESRVVFQGNRLGGNRDGARMKDLDSRAEVRGNRFGPSAEDHLSLSEVPAVVEGNDFDGAGLDLVSLEDAPVRLSGNAFGRAGRHALHLKGSTDVDARGNSWGQPDPSARIFDAADDPALGRVTWEPPRFSAPLLDLPRETW